MHPDPSIRPSGGRFARDTVAQSNDVSFKARGNSYRSAGGPCRYNRDLSQKSEYSLESDGMENIALLAKVSYDFPGR